MVYLSGSLALQADAGHMLAYLSALVLAVVALSFASRLACGEPGFLPPEILAALANGVLLIFLSGWDRREAVGRFSERPGLTPPPWR